MELAPADTTLSFEVTYDSPSLNVGMSVYNNTGGSPALVSGPSAMGHVANNTYQGKFTGEAGKSYIIIKAAYTDNTFTTVDDNYSQGSESIVVVVISGGGGGTTGCGAVLGFVDNNNILVGQVAC